MVGPKFDKPDAATPDNGAEHVQRPRVAASGSIVSLQCLLQNPLVQFRFRQQFLESPVFKLQLTQSLRFI